MIAAVAPTREFLSTRDVAELLGCTLQKVLGWLASGQLRGIDVAVRPGKKPRWRIKREDLEGFLHRRANRKPAPQPKRREAQPLAKSYY